MNEPNYEVALTKRADGDLDRFPGHEETIIRQLAELSENPAAGKPLSGSLSGTRSTPLTIPVSGQHRAAYVRDESRQKCPVFLIGTRENFYDEARRRAERLKK